MIGGLGTGENDIQEMLDNSVAYDDSVKKYAIFNNSKAGTAKFDQSIDTVPQEVEFSESDEEDP